MGPVRPVSSCPPRATPLWHASGTAGSVGPPSRPDAGWARPRHDGRPIVVAVADAGLEVVGAVLVLALPGGEVSISLLSVAS